MLMNKKLFCAEEYTAPTLRNLHIRCEAGFGNSILIGGVGEETGEWDE